MHLASLSDRLRATFVCHSWRQAFVNSPSIWSQLSLTGTTDPHFIATLLERVKKLKKSPLDITIRYSRPPIPDEKQLSPFAHTIQNLVVKDACQGDIQSLSEALPGPLPLLRTLRIEGNGRENHSHTPLNPTLPLFSGAVNLEDLALVTLRSSFLSQFAFKTITTLYFVCAWERYPISLLLDFLKASPSLQQTNMTILGNISCDVPPDRILVLPYVKKFSLALTCGWELATHLACPSAERAIIFLIQADY